LDKYYKPIKHTNWINMTPQQSSHMGDSMCNPPMSDRILIILLGSIFCLAIFIMTSRALKRYVKAIEQLKDNSESKGTSGNKYHLRMES
jgi:hypothetical protein